MPTATRVWHSEKQSTQYTRSMQCAGGPQTVKQRQSPSTQRIADAQTVQAPEPRNSDHLGRRVAVSLPARRQMFQRSLSTALRGGEPSNSLARYGTSVEMTSTLLVWSVYIFIIKNKNKFGVCVYLL